MEMNDIIEKSNAFLVEEFEVDEGKITPGAPFHRTLDLDSLDYVDLVVIVDEHFGMKMSSDDFKKIETFKDFYETIAQRCTVND